MPQVEYQTCPEKSRFLMGFPTHRASAPLQQVNKKLHSFLW
jgi:hypothetical protein